MAYLVLGLARIYSKKVEYLYIDCNGVLTEINEFVVNTKEDTRKETLRTPYYAITIPKRFELDAFDLGILEDVTGSNVASHEEITLKDNVWKNDVMLSFDENHRKEIIALHSICFSDDTDVFSLHLKDIEMQASTSHYHIMPENSQVSTFSRVKYEVGVSTGIDSAHLKAIKLFDEDHQSDEGDLLKEKMQQYEDVVPESSTEMFLADGFSYEENVIVKAISIIEEEHSEHVKSSDEDHLSEGIYREQDRSENELEFMNEDHIICNSERSMENLRDNTITLVDSMDIDMSCGVQNEPKNLIEMDSEGHDLEILEMKSPEMEDHDDVRNNLQLSISVDGISDPKFPDFAGIKTPEFTTISTPANKERPRATRKRKCIVDDNIVLSNETLKQSIYDASDLVSKRRKCPHSALTAWKASQISNLSFGFSVPLMSCVSSDLRSLLSETRVNISQSAEMLKSPENLDAPSSPVLHMLVKIDSPVTILKNGEHSNAPEISGSITTNRSEQTMTCVDRVSESSVLEQLSTSEPQTSGRLEQISVAPGTPQTSGRLEQISIAPGTPQTSGRLEQISIAPGTPVRCPTSARSFGSPESPKVPNSNAIRFCEADEIESDGWSGRTRMVAEYLLQNFTSRRVESVEKVVNLSHLLREKTRKESSSVFYEILVLKTKDCVDVKQDHAYGDILVWKLPNWGTAFGTGLSIAHDDSV
ncbi:sister chromatid cohesion 1 protein 2 isoform X3 [Momordica charantia]|nr:sister chromatid cohesion 1 protein 2 isoform X3 [Momordica charantia]